MNDIEKQLEFLVRTEELKDVFRRTYIPAGRKENDAEHSWSLCLYALVLSEYAEEGTDLLKALKMALIHDMVEIYAGDTFLYDKEGNESKAEREKDAADRIFGILGRQGLALKAIWEEFEENKSKEARFINTMDRFQPVILNFLSGGKTWKEHGVHRDMVLEAGKDKVLKASEPIRDIYLRLIEESVRRGYLLP